MLARHLGEEAHYALLYQMLSEATHASDVFAGVLRKPEPKKLQIHQIRGPLDAVKQVASLTSSYLMFANEGVRKTFFAEEQELQKAYREWYSRLRPFYQFVYQTASSHEAEAKQVSPENEHAR